MILVCLITYFFFLQLSWKEPDEDSLVKFLCVEKNFNENRVRSGAQKLQKSRSTATQGRLDSFFKVIPSNNENAKRKVSDLIVILYVVDPRIYQLP